jgi:hypothetical protein
MSDDNEKKSPFVYGGTNQVDYRAWLDYRASQAGRDAWVAARLAAEASPHRDDLPYVTWEDAVARAKEAGEELTIDKVMAGATTVDAYGRPPPNTERVIRPEDWGQELTASEKAALKEQIKADIDCGDPDDPGYGEWVRSKLDAARDAHRGPIVTLKQALADSCRYATSDPNDDRVVPALEAAKSKPPAQ